MEKRVEQGRLYDFYGELLTPHQRRIYEAAVYDDLSLAEIGEREGISRQGVHDLLRRVTKALEDYEGRLHMVERFDKIAGHAAALRQRAEAYRAGERGRLAEDLEGLAEAIMRDMV